MEITGKVHCFFEQILIHENATKNTSFFGRLWEVWTTKFLAK